MRRLAAALALLLAFWTPASFAQAGVYSDDLSKCLVAHTGDGDRTALVVWIFSAMSVHPAVEGYAKFSSVQREEMSKRAAGLFQRLMIEDCRAITIAALKYEGSSAIESSFSVLGQVAMRDLMSEPGVLKGLEQLGANIETAKFDALAREAGIPPATPK